MILPIRSSEHSDKFVGSDYLTKNAYSKFQNRRFINTSEGISPSMLTEFLLKVILRI